MATWREIARTNLERTKSGMTGVATAPVASAAQRAHQSIDVTDQLAKEALDGVVAKVGTSAIRSSGKVGTAAADTTGELGVAGMETTGKLGKASLGTVGKVGEATFDTAGELGVGSMKATTTLGSLGLGTAVDAGRLTLGTVSGVGHTAAAAGNMAASGAQRWRRRHEARSLAGAKAFEGEEHARSMEQRALGRLDLEHREKQLALRKRAHTTSHAESALRAADSPERKKAMEDLERRKLELQDKQEERRLGLVEAADSSYSACQESLERSKLVKIGEALKSDLPEKWNDGNIDKLAILHWKDQFCKAYRNCQRKGSTGFYTTPFPNTSKFGRTKRCSDYEALYKKIEHLNAQQGGSRSVRKGKRTTRKPRKRRGKRTKEVTRTNKRKLKSRTTRPKRRKRKIGTAKRAR